MKKGWKNLLTGIAVTAAGFVAYALLEDYTRKTELAQRAAEKRAEFIERRKAQVRIKAAAKTAETMTDQSLPTRPAPQTSMVKQEELPVATTAGENACAVAHTRQAEPSSHTSDIPMEDTPEAIDSAHGTDIP